MKKILLTILTLVLTVVVGAQVANAIGSLNPSGAAGDNTQYSLNDIYGKLVNYTSTPSATSSPFTTPGSVSASFRTLSEIWNVLSNQPDLVPEKIVSGATILGVAGTASSAGPAPLTWQTDPSLSLCWDAHQGCGEGSGLFNGEGAVEYCANLTAEGSSSWHLPTIAEYQSIADFSTYNNATQVPGFAQDIIYWSNTPNAEDPDYAWVWGTYYGNISSVFRSNQGNVRCVR